MTSLTRPGRGDITTMRVDRNTASGIEWVTKTIVLPVCVPEPQQLLVELVADDLVERAEGLVHQQQVGVEGQRAGDRGALLHAARELPGKLAARSRSRLTSSSVRATRASPLGLAKPMISSGSATLRAIVRQG